MVQIQQYLLIILLAGAAPLSAQTFYPDDPLWKEPPPLPVDHAAVRDINDYYDFFLNTFFEPDKKEIQHHAPCPSQAINTLGEVPDSAWFTNRIGSHPMSLADLVRGPGDANPPALDRPWIVLSGKNQGISPGLVVLDSRGRKYFLKFDPPSNPEMASAADVIGSKFLFDIGYNTPENYIVTFAPGQLALDDRSTFKDAVGHTRPMTRQDVRDVLKKVPRTPDGRYRALASLNIPGRSIGPFRYSGTRSDDPNDIVDHQNRRDLRGLYVFFAWINHTDAKSINSLDSLVDDHGLRYIRHYLIDFGDSLGSDTDAPKNPRRGHAYIFQFKPAVEQFASLGLQVPAWMRARYPHIPEIGNFDYQTFDPEHWYSNYQNPAFDLRTPGDEYWAAKKVMAFSDEAIRAIVATGQYSDPRAAEWAVRCLVERRNRIGYAFFHDVLPLDRFEVRNGNLVFEDLAVKYRFREPQRYAVRWFSFDNQSGQRTAIANARSFELPRSATTFLMAEIRSGDPGKSVDVYLRGLRVVGVDRH